MLLLIFSFLITAVLSTPTRLKPWLLYMNSYECMNDCRLVSTIERCSSHCRIVRGLDETWEPILNDFGVGVLFMQIIFFAIILLVWKIVSVIKKRQDAKKTILPIVMSDAQN